MSVFAENVILAESTLSSGNSSGARKDMALFEAQVSRLETDELRPAATQAMAIGRKIKDGIYFAKGNDKELARLDGLRTGVVDRLLDISSRLTGVAFSKTEVDWRRDWRHSAIEAAMSASAVANGRGWDAGHPSKVKAVKAATTLIQQYALTQPYESVQFFERARCIAGINDDPALVKVIQEAQFTAVQQDVASRPNHISLDEKMRGYRLDPERTREMTERLKAAARPETLEA